MATDSSTSLFRLALSDSHKFCSTNHCQE